MLNLRRADAGVQGFWAAAALDNTPLFLAAVTTGELRRGVQLIRHRGDQPHAQLLEQWLAEVLQTYGDRVLDLDGDSVQIWGRLQVPNPHNAINRQIAAIASCGVRRLDPFQGR